MTDEAQLIDAAKGGSVTAFSTLIGGHRERLFRFLLTRCASYADAEDALQDTLVSAFRYLRSYDPRWRFSTWLYRIAIRKAQRNRTIDSNADVEAVDEQTIGPLASCLLESEKENLWLVARRSLSDEVFVATWLRYVEDMSINDISRALDRSASWTKVNLLRARQRLQAELNSETDEGKAYG